ncbi:Protein SGT1 [Trichinella spiralis]|uniref:Protein SGT1 n=1 Tax=Trichinella spiralis TaxID=6334 RepID=A0ABR3K400_TRISP
MLLYSVSVYVITVEIYEADGLNEQFSSVKFDWYQSDETVTVTVKVNDVNKDDLTVEFGLKFLIYNGKKMLKEIQLKLQRLVQVRIQQVL